MAVNQSYSKQAHLPRDTSEDICMACHRLQGYLPTIH